MGTRRHAAAAERAVDVELEPVGTLRADDVVPLAVVVAGAGDRHSSLHRGLRRAGVERVGQALLGEEGGAGGGISERKDRAIQTKASAAKRAPPTLRLSTTRVLTSSWRAR